MNLNPRGAQPTCSRCGKRDVLEDREHGATLFWRESMGENICIECSPWFDMTPAEVVCASSGGAGTWLRIVEEDLAAELARGERLKTRQAKLRSKAKVVRLRKSLAVLRRKAAAEDREYEAALAELHVELAQLTDPDDIAAKKWSIDFPFW